MVDETFYFDFVYSDIVELGPVFYRHKPKPKPKLIQKTPRELNRKPYAIKMKESRGTEQWTKEFNEIYKNRRCEEDKK